MGTTWGSSLTMSDRSEQPPPAWRQPDGSPVSCQEKLKVLAENLAEVRQVCQDAFDDALLMGCDEAQVRQVLRELVDRLDATFSRD
jgi:hypothetical protein